MSNQHELLEGITMPNHGKITLFLLLLVISVLTSCATKVPQSIDEDIKDIPRLKVVAHNIPAYIGQRVRWGGIIANVVNEKEATVLEIVEHSLNKQGRPLETDQTQGRFLARFSGFLDPMVYAKGREITVVGKISKETKQLIYQFEYTYPEIVVDSFRLWQLEKRIEYIYEPYWYGPWYPRYRWSPYYDPRWHY